MSFGIVAAVGVGVSAAGAYRQAQGQKASLKYEAAVAQNNATLADYQAQIAEVNAQTNEQNSRLRTAALIGDQRATLAANGVDLGTGSAAEILATSKFMGERDALAIRDEGARKAWALREQGKGYAAEGAADSAMASAINPLMSGATSLIGNAPRVAAAWQQYNKSTKG